MADFAKHLQIVFGLLLQAVPFEFSALLSKPFRTGVQFGFNGFQCGFKTFGTGHEELFWMDPRFFEVIQRLP